MNRLEGILTLRSKRAGLKLFPLDEAGQRMTAIDVNPCPDGFRIALTAAAPWYEIADK